MKFIITVDTEADNQWAEEKKLATGNLKFLSRFQSLCEKYGFIPTYLLSYEITQDREGVKMLAEWQNQGKAEIGSHLHPWVMPNYIGKGKIYPSELADPDLKQQLKILTSSIEEKFGNRPTSYRAGRCSFPTTIWTWPAGWSKAVMSGSTPPNREWRPAAPPG